MVVNIANAQAKQGANVTLIIIDDLVSEELRQRLSPKVAFVNLKRKPGSKSLAFAIKLNRALNRLHPDVVHLHHGSLYDFLNSCWKKRACATIHDMPYGKCGIPFRPIRIIQNMVFHQGGDVINMNRIPKVFAISNSVSNALMDKYRVHSTVVDNGIITRLFRQRINSLPDECFSIVQVSRMEHIKKGHDLLIEAVRRVIDKGVNCHLTFVGDGGSRQFLENLVDRLGLRNNVTFLGVQPQDFMMSHLCDYDLFVQPSRYEGFGLTVAEAMAANVPVLVSSGQGPAEVTQNEKFGWLFDNGSIDDLVNKLLFISYNYSLCLEKVEMARLHVINNYDVSVTARKYLEEYKKILI